eukprot:g2869.t1
MEKKHDAICTECETGGELLCCDGVCLRSFHLECVGLKQVPDVDIWYCSDCRQKKHRCFKCKVYAHDKDMVRCSKNNCGRFFHYDCIGDSAVWNPPKEDGVPEFICGSHVCKECGMTDPETQCFRCMVSFHHTCRPLDVHDVDDRYFVCIAHMQQDGKRVEKKTCTPAPGDSKSNGDEKIQAGDAETNVAQKAVRKSVKVKRKATNSEPIVPTIRLSDIIPTANRRPTKRNKRSVTKTPGLRGVVIDEGHSGPVLCKNCNLKFQIKWCVQRCKFVFLNAEASEGGMYVHGACVKGS